MENRIISKKNIHKVVILGLAQLISSFLLIGFAPSVNAASKLSGCSIGMAFFVNGRDSTGSTILIDSKNNYQIQVGITQPDNTTCEPPFFWKLSVQSQKIDSGQIVSNSDFVKNITLGQVGKPVILTYILVIAEDANYSIGTAYKDIKVAFTSDPKAASPVTPPSGGSTKPAATSTPEEHQQGSGFVARPYDGVDWEGTLKVKNPSGQTDITGLITKLINWMLLIIGMVATVVIIISGIMLVFNGGSETVVKKAKTTILWAIIGLAVSIGAFALVNIIQTLL